MHSTLTWIDAQHDRLTHLLESWSSINSYTYNLPGLARMADALAAELQSFGPVEHIAVPPATTINSAGAIEHHPLGPALRVSVRPTAPIQVLLNIHYDTVYPPDSPFQFPTRQDANTLRGPGVLDAKGGILVLLTAARAFDLTPEAQKLGYTILLTPDEEIGSPGSGELILNTAKNVHYALLFEPSLPDGSIVSTRKGSGNFTFILRGRSAHAGRDFRSGRSAILAAAALILRMSESFPKHPNVTINCGKIEGGGALNVVPDLAIARFNARVLTPDEQRAVEQRIAALADEFSKLDGIKVELHGSFHAPPKLLTSQSQKLLALAEQSARDLGLTLSHKPSGGASDGNRISAAGIPTLDSLGPTGAHLHSPEEFIHLPSLVERAKLTTLLLTKLASSSPT